MSPSGKKLGVFLHMRLSGNGVELNHATEIFRELTRDIAESGLEAAADYYVIGSSGGEANYLAACEMAPKKAVVVENPLDSIAELPTLQLVHDWAKENPDAYAVYLHGKGSLHSGPTKSMWTTWRHCMSNVVIHSWRDCVKDLDDGFDCSGPHLITPEQYPSLCSSSYYGGNFWHATCKHICRLIPIDHKGWTRYSGEAWIGYANGAKIRWRARANHFPMTRCPSL